MKENKSKILILSALAAMSLASCGGGESKASSVNSTPDASTPTSISENEGSDSKADSSEEKKDSEHSYEAESSEESVSSEEEVTSHELADWVGQEFVGEYSGGFTNLYVNEDKSTSWDTDNTHFPAHVERMANGVYHIYSDESVDDEDKVDVYTDGTMAFVKHDAIEEDYFILDKGAEYDAENALARKEDGSLIFGSVVAGNKTKYFRALNGVYDFDVRVSLNYGSSIEDDGAIFDVVVGNDSSTYRTISAGSAASGLYAVIEDYDVVETVYNGMEGDLVIGRNGDEIVYVTLDGTPVGLDLVVENDDGITIKGEERILDDTDPSNMVWVYGATKYTLDELGHTYESEDATSREDVFHALDSNNGQYTATVGADGNLWATFTSDVGGLFDVNILVGTGENDSYYYSTYDYIAIYRFDAASYGSPYTYAEEYAYYGYNYYYYDYTEAEIEDFEILAGVTYIIKAGNNETIYNVLGDDGSDSEGESITIGYSFTAFDVASYTGDQGLLSLETYQGSFRGVSLNGQGLVNATRSGNTITSIASVIDFSDPNDPQKVVTTITIVLDPSTMTYTYDSGIVSSSVFHVLTEEDSGSNYSTTVGADGNLWAVFTPTSSGYLSVEEIVSTSTDGYLAIYKSTAPSFTTGGYGAPNAEAYSDYGAALSGAGKISNLLVNAGVTYVIKAGNYYDRDRELGDTGSTYAGGTEAISFVFSSILTETFSGDEGNLLLSTENGAFRGASVNGEEIPNAELVDNGDDSYTLYSMGAGTFDLTTDPLDPTRTSTDKVYSLDAESYTYTVSSNTVTRHVFTEVTSNSMVITQVVDADGNLWAKFTPSADGLLSVNELISTAADGYLAIYKSTATSFVPGGYGAPNAEAYSDKSSGTLESISNLEVEAGTTYIIKAGNYYDRDNVVGDTGSANSGKTESIMIDFAPYETLTFTGASGDLVISKAGDTITRVTLGGTVLTGGAFDEDGNFFIRGAGTVDNTDPLNPIRTSTDTIYILDSDNGSYTVDSQTRSTPIFHEVSASCTVSDAVGADGNLWIKFTPKTSGTITINELACTASDGYLAIYKSTAASFAPGSYGSYNYEAYSDSYYGLESISDFEVEAGVTYIIKAGAFADRDKLVNDTGSTFAGNVETLEFIFNADSSVTYTSVEGDDLVIISRDETVMSIMLGEEVLEDAVYKDGKVTVVGELVEGDEGAYSRSDTVYILDDETGSYTVDYVDAVFASSTDYEIAQGSPYGFTYDELGGAYTSSNTGVNSSSATMTITFSADGVFSFDYSVSSEGTTTIWDYLSIKLNGVDIPGYEKLGGTAGMSGSVSILVSEGDTITFTYYKDYSTAGGKDMAQISNLLLLTEAL